MTTPEEVLRLVIADRIERFNKAKAWFDTAKDVPSYTIHRYETNPGLY